MIKRIICFILGHDYHMDRPTRGCPTDARYETCKRCGHTRGTL